jgi:regulator of extracellular matrix RemA (YlzA/DUF370 family)
MDQQTKRKSGVVTHLFLKTDHQAPMKPVKKIDCLEGKGILGDASFGRRLRQVLIVEEEVLEGLSLEPGVVRENITVRNFPQTWMQTDTILEVGEVQLEVTGDCSPCSRMDEIRPGLQEQLEDRRGVLARVLRSGTIRLGARIQSRNLDRDEPQ